jgi:hypothetical protein
MREILIERGEFEVGLMTTGEGYTRPPDGDGLIRHQQGGYHSFFETLQFRELRSM